MFKFLFVDYQTLPIIFPQLAKNFIGLILDDHDGEGKKYLFIDLAKDETNSLNLINNQ